MWVFIIVVAVLIIIGLIANIVNLMEKKKELNFANNYYEKFQSLVSKVFEKNSLKSKDYTWLMSNCDKMQYILGDSGIISYMEYGRYYKNIPILLNVMNEIPSYINNSLIGDSEIKMVQWCINAFLRKIGILDDYIKQESKRFINPFYNLTSGIKEVLLIPVRILNSIGLISNNYKNKFKENIVVKFISGIISLLTILSVIITVVIGWKEFLEIINNFLNK